jgi:hypothetical protein
MWDLAGNLLDPGAGEVNMVEACPGLPANWPTDGRDGGVPDPKAAGPSWIQIGTEGGFLPAPAVIPPLPVGYTYNRRDITVLNISTHSLLLGPAERADVVVDFSLVPNGSKLIMYNDAPAPVPAFDPRNDYYTGDPDNTFQGGAKSTVPGYGPNTRTLMQFQVDATLGVAAAPFSVANYTTAINANYATEQHPVLVPEPAYNAVYGKVFTGVYSRIQDTTITFTPNAVGAIPMTMPMQPKTIQELFELDYGRMNATLGTELPSTNGLNQTTVPLNYVDPPTEILTDSITPMSPVAGDGTQIWKITHNGVDTHAIHFHLMDVQLINRVGWDGMVKPPDANEVGWKDTVRMNPLEDVIIALRPIAPKLPFGIPDSIRPLNPAVPIGSTMGFSNLDPLTGNAFTPPVTNQLVNFGWEYVWHCHLLGHEENDMMRPIVFNVARALAVAPILTGNTTGSTLTVSQINLTWTDGTPPPANLGNPANEIGFKIYKAVGASGGTFSLLASPLANQTTYTDLAVTPGVTYRYYVVAWNAAGNSTSNTLSLTTPAPTPLAPTNFVATQLANPTRVSLTWINPANITGLTLNRNGWAAPVNLGATIVSYIDSAVVSGTTYTYTLFGKNAAGNGPSVQVVFTVVTPPAAPTSLAVIRRTTNSVTLTWQDNQRTPPETGYSIEQSLNGTTWTVVGSVGTNVTTFTATGLTTATPYFFRVRAFTTVGTNTAYSSYSNTVTITTL